MRIAMLSSESSYSIAVGALSDHVDRLSRTLAALGNEVHLFTRRGPGQLERESVDSIHVHRCVYEPKENPVDDVNSMCGVMARSVLAAERAMGHGFHVVHAHEWLTANTMIWVKQAHGRRSILTLHTTEHLRGGDGGPGHSERIVIQERAGVYWADAIVVTSEATAGELECRYDVPESKIWEIAEPDAADGATATGVVDIIRWHPIAERLLGIYDPDLRTRRRTRESAAGRHGRQGAEATDASGRIRTPSRWGAASPAQPAR